jgi:hypothetical protein
MKKGSKVNQGVKSASSSGVKAAAASAATVKATSTQTSAKSTINDKGNVKVAASNNEVKGTATAAKQGGIDKPLRLIHLTTLTALLFLNIFLCHLTSPHTSPMVSIFLTSFVSNREQHNIRQERSFTM